MQHQSVLKMAVIWSFPPYLFIYKWFQILVAFVTDLCSVNPNPFDFKKGRHQQTASSKRACLDLTFIEQTRVASLLLNHGHSLCACALSFLWQDANSTVSLSGLCALCLADTCKSVSCTPKPLHNFTHLLSKVYFTITLTPVVFFCSDHLFIYFIVAAWTTCLTSSIHTFIDSIKFGGLQWKNIYFCPT